MKKLLIIFAILNFYTCFAQTFYAVKVYISNPYVERVDLIKDQMYNMDYVRSHYASCVFSMEQNYINSLYDSLMSLPLTEVAHDSIYLITKAYWGKGTLEMDFEPCIVIDFIRYNRFNTNEETWTFSVNRQGYVCKRFPPSLYYPDKRCIDFLKRCFPGMFFLAFK